VRMARRVEAVHRDHPDAPHGLAEHLEIMEVELLEHMEKEEQVLFPMMRAGGHPMILHPIGAMRAEHDEADRLLAQVLRVTRNLNLPEGACRSWTALYAGLGKLAADLTAHVALENDVLFARFEAA
ncbi:MAG: hemerythrin domain-containing protein, partial [Rhodobacteraceae bacterium]|nr:hemerythrin domain-containing protein [Paracoccaceae bacterium]